MTVGGSKDILGHLGRTGEKWECGGGDGGCGDGVSGGMVVMVMMGWCGGDNGVGAFC